ncbi:MAG TPA: HD-GYP domain-containing protein [Bacillota bacterium]|nr:HD-GYP domain-containing protein [Bacillota bacterium]
MADKSKQQMMTSAYLWSVTAAGVALLATVGFPREQVPGMLLFAAMVLVSELTAVSLPRQPLSASVGMAPIIAAVMLFGPASAWLAALATWRRRDLVGKVPLRLMLFNRGQLALAAGGAGWLFLALGGRVGTVTDGPEFIPAAASSAAYLGINLLLVAAAIRLLQGLPWRTTLARNVRHVAPQLITLTSLGVLFVIAYRAAGIAGAFLVGVPLLLIRYALQQYVDIRALFLSTMNGLMAAIEAKDPYTRGHSSRTAAYAEAIARGLSWPEEKIERLRYACVLHDIGKISIADAILKKPAKLTAEEYEQQKPHPTIGAEIVGSAGPLAQEAEWIRHHHERWDGTGYPEGLQGEAIPAGSRIIAVADAFDAMTSARPYRPAMDVASVLAVLSEEAGRQFDAAAVAAFLEAVPRLDLSGKGGI